MQRPLFLPTARQTNWLLVVGFLSVGYALYMRYTVIEVPAVSLACQGGLDTWLCLSRRGTVALFQHYVFGAVALGIAALNFLHPSIVLVAVSLAAAGVGIVLHNAVLSAFAVALLIVSLARRAPAPE